MVLRKRLETTSDPMEREEILIEIRLEEEVRKVFVYPWEIFDTLPSLPGLPRDPLVG